ncbi:MAG: hypothetical protein ACD_76C00142G0011 [uncultured bacterium]|nr:MAG: hypothetical protein ACD_76C00142G0011 [uncultured bacterium]
MIHVLGSAGGGRDSARREVLGRMAGAKADVVIVTNEDPYDEDPAKIIDEVSAGAVAVGKREGAGLFKILDRKQAIARAFALAKEGDLVVITGKGCEQAIVVGGRKKIKWDDRVVARELLKNLN